MCGYLFSCPLFSNKSFYEWFTHFGAFWLVVVTPLTFALVRSDWMI